MGKTEVKSYLRVTGNDEDDVIDGLLIAAEEYLTNAGVKKDYNNKLYGLAVKLMVSNWYENRMVQSEKTQSKLSFSLDAIITQLQLSPASTESEE